MSRLWGTARSKRSNVYWLWSGLGPPQGPQAGPYTGSATKPRATRTDWLTAGLAVFLIVSVDLVWFRNPVISLTLSEAARISAQDAPVVPWLVRGLGLCLAGTALPTATRRWGMIRGVIRGLLCVVLAYLLAVIWSPLSGDAYSASGMFLLVVLACLALLGSAVVTFDEAQAVTAE